MRWGGTGGQVLIIAVALGVVSGGVFVNARADTVTCASGVCVSVDSSRTIESADHQASGILHSSDGSPTDASLLAGLDVSMWRSSTNDWAGSPAPWTAAAKDHIPVTFLLSDKWLTDTDARITPWSDWARYQQWVISSVRQLAAMGIQVDYWEVYNEPNSFLPPAEASTVTADRLLTQFLIAYQAIRSVEPNAAIIGPSTSSWVDKSSSRSFSMVQFLDFAAANHLNLAAVSWHYNEGDPSGLEQQVAEARSLIAARPGLGNPRIFINEYGTQDTQRIPGWDVQYLAALTNARVDSAGRSCWADDCARPVLDGLLADDGHSTLSDYWVRAFYAQMTGEMVAASSSSSNVGVLASLAQDQSQMKVLLGYGRGCIEDPRCLYDTPLALPSVPVPVTLAVSLPWRSGHVVVTESRVPGWVLSPISQPPTQALGTFSVIATSGEPLLTINLASIPDGDAVALTLSHSS